jgi:tellurite resistance protein TerC
MEVSSLIWFVTLGALVTMFVVEYAIVERRIHVFSAKEASKWVIFYVATALAFGGFVWSYFGHEYGQQFIAGWLTEYSLSIDNIFVFIVLMSSFAVPETLKHRVLLIGVIIAIVLRAIMIVLGVAAIERFIGTFFIFAAFLLYTAYHVWNSDDEEPDPEGNKFIRFVESKVPSTRYYHESKFTTIHEGRRVITPLVLVILAVGTTDVLFALDSIPAVLGLTKETYLVVTVNAFALMGLRQLYFVLDGLMGKVIYLSKGLAIILAFISIKLFMEALHGTTDIHVPEVPITLSLGFIVVTLALTVLVSALAVRRNPELAQHAALAEAVSESIEHAGEALEALPDGEHRES